MDAKSFIYLNIIPIICVLAGTYLAAHSREGWGWFLVVALLTAVCPKGKSND